jgi:hypothetical protein
MLAVASASQVSPRIGSIRRRFGAFGALPGDFVLRLGRLLDERGGCLARTRHPTGRCSAPRAVRAGTHDLETSTEIGQDD